MKIEDLLSTARDTVSVKRVFADPYEKDGVTVIAAATVAGGAGGGSGHDQGGQEGEGAGIGMTGRPAGAYVIKGGDVIWRPAVDVNRLLAVLGVVLVAYLLSRPRLVKARAKAAKARAAS
jgi:uncharacterized spore protein YtfJ